MRCKVGRYQTHHHLVLWHRSLKHDFTTATCTAACYEPRTVRHQTQRLLAGAKTRGQQLGVDVQKHHDVSTIDAVQHRFGADEHRCVGLNGTGGRFDFLHRSPGCGLEFVAQA